MDCRGIRPMSILMDVSLPGQTVPEQDRQAMKISELRQPRIGERLLKLLQVPAVPLLPVLHLLALLQVHPLLPPALLHLLSRQVAVPVLLVRFQQVLPALLNYQLTKKNVYSIYR